MATTCLGSCSGERFVEFDSYRHGENAGNAAAASSRTESLETQWRALVEWFRTSGDVSTIRNLHDLEHQLTV